MSRADKERLLSIAKWGGAGAALAAIVWIGLVVRAWEHERIAERVVKMLREVPREDR